MHSGRLEDVHEHREKETHRVSITALIGSQRPSVASAIIRAVESRGLIDVKKITEGKSDQEIEQLLTDFSSAAKKLGDARFHFYAAKLYLVTVDMADHIKNENISRGSRLIGFMELCLAASDAVANMEPDLVGAGALLKQAEKELFKAYATESMRRLRVETSQDGLLAEAADSEVENHGVKDDQNKDHVLEELRRKVGKAKN